MSLIKIKVILTIFFFVFCNLTAGCVGTINENTDGSDIIENSLDGDNISTVQQDIIWQVLPKQTSVEETYPPNMIAPTAAGNEVADLTVYAENSENSVKSGEPVSIDVIFKSIDDSPGIINNFPPKMFVAYADLLETGRYQVVEYIDERKGDITINPGERITQNIVWTPNETGEFCLAVMDVNIFDGEGWYGYYSHVDHDRGVPVANITVK